MLPDDSQMPAFVWKAAPMCTLIALSRHHKATIGAISNASLHRRKDS